MNLRIVRAGSGCLEVPSLLLLAVGGRRMQGFASDEVSSTKPLNFVPPMHAWQTDDRGGAIAPSP